MSRDADYLVLSDESSDSVSKHSKTKKENVKVWQRLCTPYWHENLLRKGFGVGFFLLLSHIIISVSLF